MTEIQKAGRPRSTRGPTGVCQGAGVESIRKLSEDSKGAVITRLWLWDSGPDWVQVPGVGLSLVRCVATIHQLVVLA